MPSDPANSNSAADDNAVPAPLDARDAPGPPNRPLPRPPTRPAPPRGTAATASDTAAAAGVDADAAVDAAPYADNYKFYQLMYGVALMAMPCVRASKTAEGESGK